MYWHSISVFLLVKFNRWTVTPSPLLCRGCCWCHLLVVVGFSLQLMLFFFPHQLLFAWLTCWCVLPGTLVVSFFQKMTHCCLCPMFLHCPMVSPVFSDSSYAKKKKNNTDTWDTRRDEHKFGLFFTHSISCTSHEKRIRREDTVHYKKKNNKKNRTNKSSLAF